MDNWYVKGKKWGACLFPSRLLWRLQGDHTESPCPPQLENTADSVRCSSESSEAQHLDLPGADDRWIKGGEAASPVMVSGLVRA